MSDHLPECIYKPENIDSAKGIRWGGSPCICPELRVCEKRVLRDTSFTVNGPEDVAKRLSENLSKVATGAYQRGRSDALDAAREAVDSIPPIDQRVNEGFISLVYDKGEMLAAIDELRKKP